jgi:glycosyltransferase involved in cell wall biosynthesis
MKKILWIGEYAINSGFASVNRALVHELKQCFEITMLDTAAVAEMQILEGINYVGLTNKEDFKAIQRLKSIDTTTFDLIFILDDIWYIDLLLEGLINNLQYSGKIVAYFPIDNPGADEVYYKHFNRLDAAIAYTFFAKNVFLKENPSMTPKTHVIPHGINFQSFYKLNQSKSELRQSVFNTDQMNDKFIFLNANRNISRKRLDISIKAFSMMQNTNTMLWMHCGVTDLSMNIVRLGKRHGVSNRLIITNVGGETKGIPKASTETLNKIYNCCDAGLNSSMGEGWGLTNAEHASLGKPQIVGNHTAFQELYANTPELLVNIQAEWTYDNQMMIGYLIDPSDMAKKMDFISSNKENYAAIAEITEKSFRKTEFEWPKIATRFVSVFSELLK